MNRVLPDIETLEPIEGETVTLTFNADGSQVELPVLSGVHGPKVIDVQRLYRETGYFTHDPGYMSTSSCDSTLTYIDGEQGILLHRGYSIEDLAAQASIDPRG